MKSKLTNIPKEKHEKRRTMNLLFFKIVLPSENRSNETKKGVLLDKIKHWIELEKKQ